jgi:multidrug efflux pump
MVNMPKEMVKAAIIEGGGTRLRPVLLTAITTVLGLIPLAIGFNIDFYTLIMDLDPNIYLGGDNATLWRTMAWTVIYGLVFATFLTLVVVPVMYWLAYRAKAAVSNLFRSSEATL